MATTRHVTTAEELLNLPDDGYRYELIRGELQRMSPAGKQHGMLAMRLGWRLARYVEANRLGEVYAAETGFRLAANPDTVRAPDVAFVSHERLAAVGEVEGYWPGAPDLAIEVIAPGDTYTAVEDKVPEWLQAGTRMVIVVNPRRLTVTVYRSRSDIVILTSEDQLDGQEVVPGWSLPVTDVFG